MFGDKTVFSQKDLGYRKAENSPAIKKIMADKDIAKVLDEPRERQEFLDQMKNRAKGGGLSKDGLREVFGYFRLGKGKYISKKVGYEIARKFFPSGDRYRHPSDDKPQGSAPARSYSRRDGGTASKNESLKSGSSASQPQSARPINPLASFVPRFSNPFRTGNRGAAGNYGSPPAGFGKSSTAKPTEKGNLSSSSRPSFFQAMRSTMTKK